MILLLILTTFFILLLRFLYVTGWFGLYIELDLNRLMIYAWYRGDIINNINIVSIDTPATILFKMTRLERQSREKIETSKLFKKKFKNINKKL